MWLLLSGCLLIDDAQQAKRVHELAAPTTSTSTPTIPTPTPTTPTPTTGPLDPPAIASIEPAYGTDAGGTRVTIQGGPFDPSDPGLTVVTFGDAPVGIVSVDSGSLVVDTPVSATDGALDVTVTTSGGEIGAPGGFTYWPDATGQAAATGELVWFYIVGGYWSDYGPEPYGRATLRFTDGFDYQFYRNWAPDLDTCIHLDNGVPDYVYDPQFDSIDAGEGTATETLDSASIELSWNAAEVRFTNYDLDLGQVAPGETYDLKLTGTVGLPEVELRDVFTVPSEWELTSPAINAAHLPDITADQHLEWTTDEEGDAILFQIGMLNNAGDGFQEELWCAARDVGSFWLDPTQWKNWTPGREVQILAGRYYSGNTLLPWNQGHIATASQIWYYGAATAK